MKTAYIDCSNGISGNSILGALFDCGLPIEEFKSIMHDLIPNDKFDFLYEKIDLLKMSAVHFDVDVSNHNNQERNIEDIMLLIHDSNIKKTVKENAIAVFYILGEALAKAHQCTLKEVTFHEQNAIDTMIDIVGVCWGFDYFDIEYFIASPLHVGSGSIHYRFGELSIPAPATAHLIKHLPIYQTAIEGELVTPTGAAIIKTFVEKFSNQPMMNLTHIGYGAPISNMSYPGWIKVMIGSENNENV